MCLLLAVDHFDLDHCIYYLFCIPVNDYINII